MKENRSAPFAGYRFPVWIASILAYFLLSLGGIILSAGKGHLQQVYLVHETVNESYATSSFVLRYKIGTTEEEQGEIYDEIFRYLDDYPVDWEFALYDYEPSMEKPLAKVPGACIYEA